MSVNSRKVLIIDDTLEDRMTCRRWLAKDPDWHYEFMEADQGSTGIALARSEQPDCILVDYMLPDADGLGLLSRLSDLPDAPALPVVMLTGTGDTRIAVEAMKRGAQDYLVKGRFTPEDLRLAVNKAIEKAALINEQRRTVAALQAGEERLKLAMNAAAIFSWETDLVSGQVVWSENAPSVLGFAPGTMPQTIAEMQALSPPDDAAQVRDEIQKAMTRQPSAFSFEQRLINPSDNSIVWVQVQGTAGSFVNGKPTRLVGLTQNITRRKQAEEALRYRAEQVQTLVNSAPLGVYMVDADFRVAHINPTVAQAWSAIPNAGVGRDFTEIVRLVWGERLGDEIVRIFRHTLATGESYIVPEMAEVRADRGILEYHEWRVDRITLPDGRYGLVCYFRDIGEQVRARLAVDQQKRLLQSITDNATTALFVMDERQQCAFMNPAAEKLTGYTLAETRGRALHDVVHHTRPDGSPYPLAECPIDQAFPTHNQMQGEEIFIHKDGHFYNVAFTASPLLDASGTTVGTVIEVQDITARKRAESEREQLLLREQQARQLAEETSRLKDNFLTTISHELRTPLNHMLGWVVMLRGGKVAPDKAADALATIERNARLQQRLVEDLLDVSQIVAGKMQLRFQPVAPARAIEAAIASARATAEAKDIQLEVTLDPQSSTISGDPDRVQQIVWNLVSNAIKFTPPGGRVSVRLAHLESHVEITVSDTGAGIAPEYLPYLFNRFSQADSSISRKHGGLGLGLAIVRHLVELHGGEVAVASPGPGQGTTFTVRFPLARTSSPAPKPEPREAAGGNQDGDKNVPDLSGVRILAVDDEADARQLLQAVLTETGAEVRTAGSMIEALRIFDTWQPDVLVSDIGMPNGDGYDLMREIRQRTVAGKQWLPAVALTAYARAEDRMRALTAGFQMHVTKPVEPQELLVVIASLTGKNSSL
ncbi:MAG TPA: response regulator [Blastocatellia bacterium]|nr:response regulator [Blastocatellia bacterium]